MIEQFHHEEKSSKSSSHVPPDTKAVANKRQFFKLWPIKRRIKALHQMSMAECGAASLAMILTYYGRKTSLSEVRDYCGVGRDGLSARAIVQAARAYGLRVRALTLAENDFHFVQLPAIIHWEFHHFLIVEKWTHRYVDLVDPAFGRRRISAEEFDNGFTGIVLTFEPGVNFKRRTVTGRVNLLTYALSYARIAPVSLLQILGASLLLQLFGLAMPILTAVIVDTIVPSGLKNALVLLTIGLCILLVAQLTTTLLRSSVLLYLQTKVDAQMMLGFFERLITLPLQFFQQRSSGDILARLNSNTVVRDLISNQFISTILDSTFVLVYLVILFTTSPIFGVLVLLLSLVQLALLVVSNYIIRELTVRELTAQGKSQGYASEALVGMTTLKAAGAEHRAFHRWTNLFFDQMNASVRRIYVSSVITTIITTLQTFAPVFLLVVGTLLVFDNSLSVGTMLALIALSTALLTPLSTLVNTGQSLQQVQAHLERIADVMEAEPEQDVSRVHEPPPLTGAIRLENVSFRYNLNSKPVLHNISVTLAPGEKVAIVGRSGSGKTTLGSLLLGLYLPTTGKIFYDDLELRTLNYQAVRTQFGVVTQSSTIFNGSVRDNIALNDPAIPLEKVQQVARAAAIHQDISQMPMGYETLVSESGNAISGGQRQRLALARALATDPALLLLDEATSALDVVTEQIIEQNLRELACTQIIIAHRLSTVRNADVILVLDEGTIIERGSHQELLAKQGYYARLIQSQLPDSESPTMHRKAVQPVKRTSVLRDQDASPL
ncbi:MAG TPA: peptidase domain-containing ABC transporter [Ktedonobacteraceae bacterium]|nr:peptidase domain-containing ABC transporter [Ktedonobacteraceae bacterium]